MKLALVVTTAGEVDDDYDYDANTNTNTTAAGVGNLEHPAHTGYGIRIKKRDNIQNHMDALLSLGGLVAICETGASRVVAETAGAMPDGVVHYDDLDAMIKSQKFDAAVLVSYAGMGATASRLLGAKKHVFVAEWPMVLDAAEGTALLRLAEKKRVVLECERMLDANGTVSWLRQAVSDGCYGRLAALGLVRRGYGVWEPYVYGYGNDVWSGGPGDGRADDGDDNDDNNSSVTAGPGRGKPRKAGVLDARVMHARDIHAVSHIFGSAPNMVFARAYAAGQRSDDDDGHGSMDGTCRAPPECMSIMLGYEGGRVATISSSSSTLAPGEEFRMDATFERASITADAISQTIVGVPCDVGPNPTTTVNLYDDSSGLGRDRVTRTRRAIGGTVAAATCMGQAGGRDALPKRGYSPFQEVESSIYNFARCARKKTARGTGRAPKVLASVRAAEAALLSSRRGIPVYLDLRMQ